MNIFWVLALNIGSFTAIACMVNERGLPSDKWEFWIVMLFAVNAICNIYYIVSKEITKKKDDKDKCVSGTFIPNHDVKEVHTVRR